MVIEKDGFRDDRTRLSQALSVLCIEVKFCLPSLSHQSVSKSFFQYNFSRGLFGPDCHHHNRRIVSIISQMLEDCFEPIETKKDYDGFDFVGRKRFNPVSGTKTSRTNMNLINCPQTPIIEQTHNNLAGYL